jgi:hypothetical protein
MLTVEVTPYEQACGIDGGVTATRAWGSRFLRAVTDRLWLGPDLLARVGGSAALEPVADIRPVGDAVALALRRPATLADLERVLAPVLPRRSDWETALRAERAGRPLIRAPRPAARGGAAGPRARSRFRPAP